MTRRSPLGACLETCLRFRSQTLDVDSSRVSTVPPELFEIDLPHYTLRLPGAAGEVMGPLQGELSAWSTVNVRYQTRGEWVSASCFAFAYPCGTWDTPPPEGLSPELLALLRNGAWVYFNEHTKVVRQVLVLLDAPGPDESAEAHLSLSFAFQDPSLAAPEWLCWASDLLENQSAIFPVPPGSRWRQPLEPLQGTEVERMAWTPPFAFGNQVVPCLLHGKG